MNIYPICLNVSFVGQIPSCSPAEKREVAGPFASDQVKITIFIPIANCDCRSLASARTQRDDRAVGLEIDKGVECRIIMRSGILVEADSPSVKLA